jgi:hypothetical protein
MWSASPEILLRISLLPHRVCAAEAQKRGQGQGMSIVTRDELTVAITDGVPAELAPNDAGSWTTCLP